MIITKSYNIGSNALLRFIKQSGDKSDKLRDLI